MIVRIQNIRPLSDLKLYVTFDDGRAVVYDVADDITMIPSYNPLRIILGLFEQAKVDESRTCVIWNDEIDLPSDIIYEYGRELCPANR